MSERIDFKVKGLDCAEEVAILKSEIGKLEGVEDLDFDVFQARMSVFFDPDQRKFDDFAAAVARTGMTAVPWSERQNADTGSWWHRYGRLLMTILSGCCLLAGFVYHGTAHGFFQAFAGGHETEVFPALSLVLYVIAIAAGGRYVFPKAFFALRRLRPDMNLLMTIAVIGAMIIQEWFEAATVTFLFAVALLLEQWSVERARSAIGAILDLTPASARFRDSAGHVHEKPIAEVPVGATVLVRPGEKIPLDGVVIKGTSMVNQAPITGESMPVDKEAGDDVYAGTLNSEGAFEFKATKAAEDTMLARIIHMVEEAQSRRAPTQQWVDRFSLYYTPAMILLALLLAVTPPLLFSASWSQWFYQALVILVIACPCALVIATPVSIVSGLTTAARHGVLIKGGVYLEQAGQLKALALDKTGTLTRGQPEVQKIVPLGNHTETEVLQLAAGLEYASEHPIARAILRKAQLQQLTIPAVEDYTAIAGKGGEGRIGGIGYWIGSHRLLKEKREETEKVHATAAALVDAGHTVIALGNDRHVCGLISVADEVRKDAATAIQELQRAGIEHIVMLTGDNEATAKDVAATLGLENYWAELLPEDKVETVRKLRQQYDIVAMVGDGINDAPSMAAASFGIAMGAIGTDAAIETADITLMTDDLLKLPWLMRHSRRTLNIIKANIAFALSLKIIFVTLSILGLASLWMAIAADTGATLLVVFNSLRLLRK